MCQKGTPRQDASETELVTGGRSAPDAFPRIGGDRRLLAVRIVDRESAAVFGRAFWNLRSRTGWVSGRSRFGNSDVDVAPPPGSRGRVVVGSSATSPGSRLVAPNESSSTRRSRPKSRPENTERRRRTPSTNEWTALATLLPRDAPAGDSSASEESPSKGCWVGVLPIHIDGHGTTKRL